MDLPKTGGGPDIEIADNLITVLQHHMALETGVGHLESFGRFRRGGNDKALLQAGQFGKQGGYLFTAGRCGKGVRKNPAGFVFPQHHPLAFRPGNLQDIYRIGSKAEQRGGGRYRLLPRMSHIQGHDKCYLNTEQDRGGNNHPTHIHILPMLPCRSAT